MNFDSHEDKHKQIVGMLFPVPEYYLRRIFDERKDVFVKYLPKSVSKLKRGNKIIFYASRSSKHLVGEAVIGHVEFLTPDEVIEKYGNRVFITKEELLQYTKRQPSRTPAKRLFVAIMKRIKKYAEPVFYKGHITMAGAYLTMNSYREILDQAM